MPEDLTTAALAAKHEALEEFVFLMAEILIGDGKLDDDRLLAGPQGDPRSPEIADALTDMLDRLASQIGARRPDPPTES